MKITRIQFNEILSVLNRNSRITFSQQMYMNNQDKTPIEADYFYRLRDIANMKWQAIPKLIEFLETVRPKKQRTSLQNAALHVFLKQKTDQCREAGISVQKVLNETFELEMTEKFMKEIWREVQKAMYHKKSTTELEKSNGEIDDIAEHLNRFFAKTPFNLEGLPFPSNPEKMKALEEEASIPKSYQGEYPEEDLGEPVF